MNTLLIAGTDTEVGKTILSTALAAYWQTYGKGTLGLMKLMQTGIGDREQYQQLFSAAPSIVIRAPLCFKTPVAPPIAAEREGRQIDLATVWQTLNALQQQDFVVVEALGGLGTPVTHELTVADLARDWRLPTLLVVPVKLGALGVAIANVALARQAKLALKGIVLNCLSQESESKLADWTPPELLESFTSVPVLGILPYLTEPTNLEQLTQVASNLDLEVLLPTYAAQHNCEL